MKRILLTIGAVVTACVLTMAAPASAQTPVPPPSTPTGTLSPSAVSAGGTVTVTAPAGTFAPGTSVVVRLEGTTLATGTANATGGFSATVTIPTNVAIGTFGIFVQGTGINAAPLTISAGSLTVAARAVAPPQGRLPVTGQSLALPVSVALALILVGFGLVNLRRRSVNSVA